ncbi:Ubiquinone biosynthesis protein coq4, mitochondrial [Taphrina deformans PYCC 5710]|uniref:4-hydroxy-3-methoxy-5-polyprenylbenzoate decarboxylase n=1 Tax=Taphrina deformans (strain PYCC 5710 / ATCC 11124 / CBS 356.35 / IMI 108563 / JCM 9778 / NBRC 8474) TaxID=1097556 RepID=R4XFE4_TAPDE|nr:Ubiquinone biosynthesis protein coq4, mitochondrial [Taphrina deformans PYCC 5710]|eukprot:CCG83176.1 Ubiquinone biosynthesis protein coq4, mitochondrial [Taphrina deformans PYCC 5710]
MYRQFRSISSIPTRPGGKYPGHVPLSFTERIMLATGSAIQSLVDPRRGDMIAALSEATAQPYFINRLRDQMLAHPTGRQILKDRPRITSQTLSLEYLRGLPQNSVGYTYGAWLDREGVTPDTRDATRYIDDEECAYVMQRYREAHDFYHAITGLPVIVEGEIALKWFEWTNMGLPVAGLSALFGPLRLSRKQRARLRKVWIPWALSEGQRSTCMLNVYWEKELLSDCDELRAKLGFSKPPDLRRKQEWWSPTGEIKTIHDAP